MAETEIIEGMMSDTTRKYVVELLGLKGIRSITKEQLDLIVEDVKTYTLENVKIYLTKA